MNFAFNPLGMPFDLVPSSSQIEGNSISGYKVNPNGSTSADVALSTNAATAVLAVALSGLAHSTIYQTTVRVTAVIYEDASPEITGSIDLTCDMVVTVDPSGNVFCGFSATQSPDLSRLVGTALSGATVVLGPSTGGFTVKATRPSGVACHARCTWTTNHFEAVGVASDIPQAGTWSTGGYWDADHGIGGTSSAVTSITSRESTSALVTAGGTVHTATDTLTNTTILIGDGSATMNEINSRWAAFGGAHTPFILFLQMTIPTSASGIIANVSDASNANRACETLYAAANIVGAYRVQGGLITQTTLVTPSARKTVAFVLHTDGNFYVVDETGTAAPVSDATINSLTVDRFTLGTNSKFRRFGVKLPATANPLLECQQLVTRLLTMT